MCVRALGARACMRYIRRAHARLGESVRGSCVVNVVGRSDRGNASAGEDGDKHCAEGLVLTTDVSMITVQFLFRFL